MTQRQKIAFVLAACDHGTVILNRLDWKQLNASHIEFGPGTDILVHGASDLDLISLTGGLLEARRQRSGDPHRVLALDCGANIGAYTIEWAKQMADWGSVLAFEPQERIYYALAGNIAINNLYNAKAVNEAVGARRHIIEMPVPDYQLPGAFGGLNLRGNADIGQVMPMRAPMQVVPIDSLGLPRVDFIKLDVEGMEMEALHGATETISAHQPYMLVEWHISGKEPIEEFLSKLGYETVTVGMNLVCGPRGDEAIDRVRAYIAEAMKQAEGAAA